MKLNFKQENLLKVLQSLAPIVSSSTHIPILENILFNATTGRLTIVVSDIETTIQVNVECDVIERGAICVPARLFIETIKTLNNREEIEFSVENIETIKIKTISGEYTMQGYPHEEYPLVPSVVVNNEFVLSSEVLASSITNALPFTTDDQLRPAMTGILFELEDNRLTVVATDAHRLSLISHQRDADYEDGTFILPKKPATLLKNIVTSEVEIAFGATQARFSFDDYTVITRIIDKKYPNYRAVIPKDNDKEIKVNKAELTRMIRRALLYSNENTSQIIFELNKNKLSIKAVDVDYSRQSLDVTIVETNTEQFSAGYNGKFMLDMLRAIEGDTVIFHVKEPNRAALTYDSNNSNVVFLLMPVMVV